MTFKEWFKVTAKWGVYSLGILVPVIATALCVLGGMIDTAFNNLSTAESILNCFKALWCWIVFPPFVSYFAWKKL